MPDFKPYMLQCYDRLTAIALNILEAMMMGMDLSEEDCQTLRQLHAPHVHHLRLTHYLPMTTDDQNEPNKIRLAPHRDFA